MGFYDQRATLVQPGWRAGDYGGSVETWNPDEGATATPISFGVDVQPWVSTETLEDGTRISTMHGYRLHTPPGRDLVVDERTAVQWRGDLYTVKGTKRWPSGDYPSGVDHVVLDLELREG